MNTTKIGHLKIPSSSHSILFYENEEEKNGQILSFIKDGLDNGEAAIYISDRDDDRYQRLFGNFDIDIKSKGLRVVDVMDWYLDHGSLNGKKVVKKLNDAMHWANKSGFKKLRVTGGTAYFFENKMVDELMSYELSLPKRFSLPITAICQYKSGDVASHDEGTLLTDLLRVHGTIVTPNLVKEMNFQAYYLEAVEAALDTIFGETTRQALLYHINKKYALPKQDIPVRPLEFRRALESLLGPGGTLVDRAIQKQIYTKIGLRHNL